MGSAGGGGGRGRVFFYGADSGARQSVALPVPRRRWRRDAGAFFLAFFFSSSSSVSGGVWCRLPFPLRIVALAKMEAATKCGLRSLGFFYKTRGKPMENPIKPVGTRPNRECKSGGNPVTTCLLNSVLAEWQ